MQQRATSWVHYSYFTIAMVTMASITFSCQNSFHSSDFSSYGVEKEKAYCTNQQSFNDAVTITGTALYEYRNQVMGSGLVGDPVTRGIPYSEVVVYDSLGEIIQCSETGSAGEISLTVPQNGTYRLQVNSRALNSKIKVSVLEEIQYNKPYSIETTFTTTTANSLSIGNLTAYARQSTSAKIEGGAFNILWAIYQANEAMRAITGLNNFVAEKVTVYWKAGFNPYSYFGAPNTLISFYRPGESKLYILGGTSGQVKKVDTDHFDNSVILHEYGHFLEDIYGYTDSPGGAHTGAYPLDARLAWSEGWANFFQGFAQGTRYYIDTIGFSGDSVETDASGAEQIRFDLNDNPATSLYHPVSITGEGTFREVSISRALYKAINTAGVGFNHIWTAFSDPNTGLRSSSARFRNIGLFNSYLYSVLNSLSLTSVISTWETSVLNSEKQSRTTKYYADILTPQGSSCGSSPSISPTVDYYLGQDSNNNSVTNSNKFTSNKFYSFYHDGTDYSISLNYSNTGSKTIDLDLIVYKQDYTIVEDYYLNYAGKTNSTIAISSRLDNPGSESGTETISMSGLATGWYMINIKAKTYGRINSELNGTATFNLTKSTGSNYLCPQNP